MVLKTVNGQGVETYKDLGCRFSVITERQAKENFDEVAKNYFRDSKKDFPNVFAFCNSETAGYMDIPVFADDYNIILTNDGQEFYRLVSPLPPVK